MASSWWLLPLMLQALHGVTDATVKLNNGGFEDLVIAINPQIPEDNKIVDNIKGMVQEASAYLFGATQKRFYFKTVKVIIPSTWKTKADYQRVTRESYDKAEVIVAAPYLKHGDDPYTLQYGGCGEPGRYIHLTPNFLTNDKLLDAYGPRGRVLVHEWAHLRWGVFDEYNDDAPFYSPGGNSMPEATRCPATFKGSYVVLLADGTTRPCKVEPKTQLYESGCQFIPEKNQNTPTSIMYVQSIPSVTQFCDKSNHNTKATNMQNKMCNYRSTWDVITTSPDFAKSTPQRAPPPSPTITLLQKQERVLCLVLDVSGSMGSSNRIGRLKQAAEIFVLQIIEAGSWVGVVTFNDAATVQTHLRQISDDSVRKTLAGFLPTSAGGGTKICSGVRSAFQVFLKKYPNTRGCEIVLLTDGEDNQVNSCFTEVRNSGSIIHTIALGPKAEKELEMLADMTGGLKFAATDSLNSNGLIDAFSGISSGSGDLSQQSIQLESKTQQVAAKKWMYGTVSIDKTVGKDTFFVITWSASTTPPEMFLDDPKGKKYRTKDFITDKTNLRTARLQISGIAEAGDWRYSLQNQNTAQTMTITVTSRARSATVPPVHVMPLIKRTHKFPDPLVIHAEVSQGFLPVTGAKVIATIEADNGAAVDLELLDNGAGADIIKDDGIYSRYFTSFKVNGRHNLKVRVQGQGKTGRRIRRQSQAFFAPGFVNNGVINMNPPKPEVRDDDIEVDVGNFSRVASGGSFVMSGVPPGSSKKDVFPPCRITDLEIKPLGDYQFLLSWTAPGNDYDEGKAERYEIKMSEDPSALIDAAFQTATSVNTAGLKMEVAGVKQSFQYNAENLKKSNGTSIYFAIRAIDGSNNVGEASNIARAVDSVSVLNFNWLIVCMLFFFFFFLLVIFMSTAKQLP
uniref:Calcium-activated chloride channel regulator 1-like n=1 Tax=Podarcis muralis TaxID=64176 RepID=A0A670IIQ7_PODMU